jgi:hypothetical protein
VSKKEKISPNKKGIRRSLFYYFLSSSPSSLFSLLGDSFGALDMNLDRS